MIQAWSLNDRNLKILPATSDEDLTISILQPPASRNQFSSDSYSVSLPRFFLRVIGMTGSESEYIDYIHSLMDSMEEFSDLYFPFSDVQQSTAESQLVRDVKNSTANIKFEQLQGRRVEIVDIYNALSMRDLLPSLPNAGQQALLLRAILQVAQHYHSLSGYVRVDVEEQQNLFTYLLHLTNRFVIPTFKEWDYASHNPKTIAYGDLNRVEAMGVYFLSLVGFDVLYFHSSNDHSLGRLEAGSSLLVTLPRMVEGVEIPNRSSVSRADTVGKQASNTLEETLGVDSGYFRKWSLREHDVDVVTLKTVFPELPILLNEHAQIRPNWTVANRSVTIPNIFVKISGIVEDGVRFETFQKLLQVDRNSLHHFFPEDNMSLSYLYTDAPAFRDLVNLSLRDDFNYTQLLASECWEYKNFPIGIQTTLAKKIVEVIKSPVIHPNQIPVTGFQQEVLQSDLKKYHEQILLALLELPDEVGELLINFDYPSEIPKIYVFRNGSSPALSVGGAYTLYLYNRLGFDVVVINSSGYTDIENYIDSEAYDIITLDKFSHDFRFPDSSSNDSTRQGYFGRFVSKFFQK